MSDVGPYGTLQNPDADAVTADQLVGSPAGNVTAHQLDGRFAPARFSTAPYQPPAPAATTTATVPATPTLPVVIPARVLCLKESCASYPTRDSAYCRWHQP